MLMGGLPSQDGTDLSFNACYVTKGVAMSILQPSKISANTQGSTGNRYFHLLDNRKTA